MYNELDALLEDPMMVVVILDGTFLHTLGQSYVTAALSRKDVRDRLHTVTFVPEDMHILQAAADANKVRLILQGLNVVGYVKLAQEGL